MLKAWSFRNECFLIYVARSRPDLCLTANWIWFMWHETVRTSVWRPTGTQSARANHDIHVQIQLTCLHWTPQVRAINFCYCPALLHVFQTSSTQSLIHGIRHATGSIGWQAVVKPWSTSTSTCHRKQDVRGYFDKMSRYSNTKPLLLLQARDLWKQTTESSYLIQLPFKASKVFSVTHCFSTITHGPFTNAVAVSSSPVHVLQSVSDVICGTDKQAIITQHAYFDTICKKKTVKGNLFENQNASTVHTIILLLMCFWLVKYVFTRVLLSLDCCCRAFYLYQMWPSLDYCYKAFYSYQMWPSLDCCYRAFYSYQMWSSFDLCYREFFHIKCDPRPTAVTVSYQMLPSYNCCCKAVYLPQTDVNISLYMLTWTDAAR